MPQTPLCKAVLSTTDFCPQRDTCFRFLAKPMEFQQPWFPEVPGKYLDEDKTRFVCDQYDEVEPLN